MTPQPLSAATSTSLATTTAKRVLVTAALPYANGDVHLGHLVEYIMADIYVRGLKALGTDAHLMCASDAHGTPIELNAAKRGLAPEVMVSQVREVQQQDFRRFGVAFDYFGNTHSPSNQALVTHAYEVLKKAGWIVEREQDGNYCPNDQRFLPDRFVKGGCPRCGAQDQYGDVCESCGATYGPLDLVQPKCALCGSQPQRRPSTHAFFRLSDAKQADFLRAWIDSGALQDDVANYVRSWIDGGLKDWCISRDKPYFGFPIPDMADKFFYVWLDAPFGYVSASQEWGEKNGLDLKTLWRSDETRIEHIIGKDIMYFHTLFWPAVLKATGYTLPSKVHVHGMLTVDGEKMSKSRGTFINAKVFAEHVEPEILRYYFATKYTPESRDVGLSFADMVARINGELINKYVNLFSRLGRFVHARFAGKLTTLPFAQADVYSADTAGTDAHNAAAVPPATWPAQALQTARKVVAHAHLIEDALRARDIARATRELSHIADLGNEVMQAQEPWAIIKEDPALAQQVCTFVANVCEVIVQALWPIVPELASRAAKTFGFAVGKLDATCLFGQQNWTLQPFERLMERLEPEALEKVVNASKQAPAANAQPAAPATPAAKQAPAKAAAKATAPAATGTITFAQFGATQLRVGTVRTAERLPKSNKLLRLQIDLGEPELRQVLAGLGKVYAPEDLVETQVLVVANLAPATIMGQQSCGMVLCGDDAQGQPVLLRPSVPLPPGAAVH